MFVRAAAASLLFVTIPPLSAADRVVPGPLPTGETPQDIETFEPQRFIEALFGEQRQPQPA